MIPGQKQQIQRSNDTEETISIPLAEQTSSSTGYYRSWLAVFPALQASLARFSVIPGESILAIANLSRTKRSAILDPCNFPIGSL
jgi:hypothetical protein